MIIVCSLYTVCLQDFYTSCFQICYGSTETSPVVTQSFSDDPIDLKVKTIGRASAHTEVSVGYGVMLCVNHFVFPHLKIVNIKLRILLFSILFDKNTQVIIKHMIELSLSHTHIFIYSTFTHTFTYVLKPKLGGGALGQKIDFSILQFELKKKKANIEVISIFFFQVKIVASDGAVLKLGDPGEVCTRGYSTMIGYWNDKEKTEKAIDQARWYHTG